MLRLSHILLIITCQLLLTITGVVTPMGYDDGSVCRAASSAAARTGEQNEQYDVTRPLIYEDSWEKWPYAYVSDEGKARGFNVELMTKIMQRLKIPYEVRLRNQETTHDDLKADSADISLGVVSSYNAPFGRFGKVTVCQFTNSMLVPRSDSMSLVSLEYMRSHPIIVRTGSRVYRYALEHGIADSLITVVPNMENEILREVTEGIGGAIWESMMMKWMINKYHLQDRYVAVPVDMPIGEYRFMSGDTILLARVDSVCSLMQESGELDKIMEKWLYPETKTTENSYTNILLTLLGGTLLIILLFYVASRFQRIYSRKTLREVRRQLELVLLSNKSKVWVYFPEKHRYAWMTNDGVTDRYYSSFEFSRFYPDDDFNVIHSHVIDMLSGVRGPVKENLHCISFDDHSKTLDVEVTMQEMYDEYGKIYLVCGVQYDITGSKAVLDNMKVLQQRYSTAFAMARGTVMRFNESGKLVAINEVGLDRLGISDPEAFFAEDYSIYDVDLLRDIDIDNCPVDLRFTHIVHNRDLQTVKYARSKFFKHKPYAMQGYYDSNEDNDGKKEEGYDGYYEVHLVKSVESTGKPISYMLFINNRTDEIRGQRKLLHRQQQVKALSVECNTLHKRRDYTLGVSDIWMIGYNPSSKELVVYDRDSKHRPTFSQVNLLEYVDANYIKRVFKVFRKLDTRTRGDITIDVKTYMRNERGEQRYFHFDVRPDYDSNGAVVTYFGTCRDITVSVYAQKKLDAEMAVVQEAERLKSDFLKNTSYSLRQPLINISQSISRLANGVSTEVQNDIIGNITGNIRRLIKLSDDTLLLSRIEAGMLTIRREPTDFVPLFLQTAQETMAEYPSANVTHTVENTYEKLMLNVDPVLLKRILHEVIALSARYTNIGHIVVRYMYVKGVMSFVVQDNGQGIPPSIMSHLFEPHIGEELNVSERTVYLSGLEMPICKALVGLGGGTLDVESEPGRGTSIYIRIGLQAYDSTESAEEDIADDVEGAMQESNAG